MQLINKIVYLLACTGFTLVATAAAKDWMQRPEIRAVRAVYQEVQTAVQKKQLKKTAAAENCFRENNYVTELYWYADATGRVRQLHIAYGTSDSVGELDYYYDNLGKHRFTYYQLGAVNGTQQEIRAYFAANGKELYRDIRLIEGSGYPSGTEEYVPEPLKHVAKLCD
jgi:hypothetical protein